jgi:hypothetical protein
MLKSSGYVKAMTSSQQRLFERVVKYPLQLVWGPPGTGCDSLSLCLAHHLC